MADPVLRALEELRDFDSGADPGILRSITRQKYLGSSVFRKKSG
jgi:hypothetical protein